MTWRRIEFGTSRSENKWSVDRAACFRFFRQYSVATLLDTRYKTFHSQTDVISILVRRTGHFSKEVSYGPLDVEFYFAAKGIPACIYSIDFSR